MADTDLIKLYSQRILALAADIPHAERLAAPDATVQKRSPLCGSTVTVDVALDASGALGDLGMDVRACALGQASAAILGADAIGRTRDEIAEMRDALKTMLQGGGATERFEVLTPAVDYKNRHASILLAWEATVDAMDAAAAKGADAAAASAADAS